MNKIIKYVASREILKSFKCVHIYTHLIYIYTYRNYYFK